MNEGARKGAIWGLVAGLVLALNSCFRAARDGQEMTFAFIPLAFCIAIGAGIGWFMGRDSR